MIKGGNTLNSLNKGKYVDSLEMAVSFSLLCLVPPETVQSLQRGWQRHLAGFREL